LILSNIIIQHNPTTPLNDNQQKIERKRHRNKPMERELRGRREKRTKTIFCVISIFIGEFESHH
jgi:hypothetical protein